MNKNQCNMYGKVVLRLGVHSCHCMGILYSVPSGPQALVERRVVIGWAAALEPVRIFVFQCFEDPWKNFHKLADDACFTATETDEISDQLQDAALAAKCRQRVDTMREHFIPKQAIVIGRRIRQNSVRCGR